MYSPYQKQNVRYWVLVFFDPLGISCPITTFSKILLREICSDNFEWDSLLTVNILKKWELWLNKLALLLTVCIPWYLFSDILPSTKIELHRFCESSTRFYAAVGYITVFDSWSQRCKCHIVAAKSKVAPVKQSTIPRLELSGCLLLSKFIYNIFSVLTKCHLVACVNCWTVCYVSKTREKSVENG